jgi:hypothetical protein
VERRLDELAHVSFVAHRDAQAALPALRRHGEAAAAAWLDAARRLFLHDREAGKAFIRASGAAESACGAVEPWTRQALEFLRFRGAWKAVEGFMDNLPQAYAVLGHAGEARWAEIGLQWCARHVESGAAYFRTPVADLAARQGVTGIEHLTGPAEELFETRRLMLASYLPGALKVRNLFGAQLLLPWAQRGADILQAGRLRGEAYFRLESDESLHILLDQMAGYRLGDHERLLGYLLAAWFDDPPGLRASDWSPEKGRAFVETDGRELFLPVAMPERDEALLAVIHTAGHLAFGTYARRALEAVFRAAGAEIPPAAPDRPLGWQALYARYGDEALAFSLLFDLCEDLRVDARIAADVPNHLRRLERAAARRAPAAEPAATYFRLALDSVRCLTDPAGVAPPRRAEIGWDRLEPLTRPGATPLDAFHAADALHRSRTWPAVGTPEERADAYLPGRSPNAARAVYPRDAGGEGREGDGDAGEQEQAGAAERAESPDEPSPREAAPDADAAAAEQGPGSAGETGLGQPGAAHASGGGAAREAAGRGIPYPEWDYRDQRYKRNWAWVQERRLAESNPGEAARLAAAYADALARLKRAIQAQKPTRLAPRKRQLEGEEVDIDAAVDFIVERRAGRTPAPSVYRQRRPQQRDTSVMLLADLSTSVMQQLPDGQGRIVDRIRAGLLLFAEAMEVVGDPYAIAGFSSKYRDNVSYYRIKDFGEPLTPEVRSVIGGLSGRLATRMGTAIRHAMSRFADSPSPRRLLLILSDGRPEDYDDGGDMRYLHEDTRVAVKEAIDRGVHPFCLTVDPAGSEYLPRIFGAGHYLVLDRINSLPRKLPEIYLRLRR